MAVSELCSIENISRKLDRLLWRAANLWLGQVGNRGDPFGGIGSIHTRTEHCFGLLAQRFGPQLYDNGPSAAIPKPGIFAIVSTFSEQQINSFSLYLLVSVKVINPDIVISRPRLTDEASRLLESRGWDTFEQTYGPEYMSGVSTGGYYYGLIYIQTKSQEEREEIRVRISASGGWGTGSASGNANLNQTLREVTRNRETRVTVLQSGVSGDPLEMTVDAMIAQALAFPEIVRANPVAYQGIFAEYKNTVPLPDSIGEGTFDRQRRLDVLEEIGRKYFYYKDLRSNIDYVINHILEFEEYQSMERGAIREKLDNFNRDFQGVSNQINDLVRHARICRESPRDCTFPTDYYEPIESLPRIEGQNMMLKKLEEEVARLRQQIDQAHARIGAVDEKAQNALNHGVFSGHAVNNIHLKTRDTHAFNNLKDGCCPLAFPSRPSRGLPPGYP